MPALTRRSARLVLGGAALAAPVLSRSAYAANADVTKEMILNDPAAPVAGNPKGDLTIVAFLDYNCPYCKKCEPDLDRVVKEDGKIRLVYKDWPVIWPTSINAAKMVLAARYQGKYDIAHHALMSIPGSRVEPDQMRQALQKAGVDMQRLDADIPRRPLHDLHPRLQGLQAGGGGCARQTGRRKVRPFSLTSPDRDA